MGFRLSVDTGGTFTDVVVADASGIVALEKALTTPDRIFDGMKIAMELAASKLGLSLRLLLARTELVVYGTTRAANAIVEGKTAKTAMLLTSGFPDILVFREGGKYRPHDFSLDYPDSYIPRRRTFEIDERVSSEGDIVVPVDLEQVMATLRLLQERKFEAIAVCFLWSIVNPVHEAAVGNAIEKQLPGVPYTLSHRLIPIVREYRRASATAIDASLKPLMQKHLWQMEADLRDAGFSGEVLISTSVGGCMHIQELSERPIHTVKSGPAMAPVAGRNFARMERLGSDVIVCDTGGTTFDVGLVRDDSLVYTRDSWLGPRFTGHILSMSTIDVRSIGAGGGSIAWIDAGGLLRVGPRSAGATPGPACYGNGGTEATVTDAAVVLGYLDPTYFLGGRIGLDESAARCAIETVASGLRLSLEETAFAIIRLANEHMINAIGEITINEGINPRDSVVIAGGGAAGLNIGLIARELGCKKVVLPRTAAALSACGMQFSDIVFEHAASGLTLTSQFDYDSANSALGEVRTELERFRQSLVDRGLVQYTIEYYVEARYLFQIWELEVPLFVDQFLKPEDVDELVSAFHQAHERVFAVADDESPVECLNWKGRITIDLIRGEGEGQSALARPPRLNANDAVSNGERLAYFGDGVTLKTPVFAGAELAPSTEIVGPAIIQEETTTIVVYPGMSAYFSEMGNYVLITEQD